MSVGKTAGRQAEAPDACGLAIFVKTPDHSALKTRLAATIGIHAARAFHELASAATGAVARAAMASTPNLHVYWAVAEHAALDAACWSSLPRLAQGEGDLGARMRRVCETLRQRHGAALLVGADAPQLCVNDLLDARRALAAHAHVIGGSEDGGFWLFGTRAELPMGAWTTTPWSQSDTAARFVASLGEQPTARIRPLRDVDTADDLAPLLAALDNRNDLLPEQQALAQWLRAVRSNALRRPEAD